MTIDALMFYAIGNSIPGASASGFLDLNAYPFIVKLWIDGD